MKIFKAPEERNNYPTKANATQMVTKIKIKVQNYTTEPIDLFICKIGNLKQYVKFAEGHWGHSFSISFNLPETMLELPLKIRALRLDTAPNRYIKISKDKFLSDDYQVRPIQYY